MNQKVKNKNKNNNSSNSLVFDRWPQTKRLLVEGHVLKIQTKDYLGQKTGSRWIFQNPSDGLEGSDSVPGSELGSAEIRNVSESSGPDS